MTNAQWSVDDTHVLYVTRDVHNRSCGPMDKAQAYGTLGRFTHGRERTPTTLGKLEIHSSILCTINFYFTTWVFMVF